MAAAQTAATCLVIISLVLVTAADARLLVQVRSVPKPGRAVLDGCRSGKRYFDMRCSAGWRCPTFTCDRRRRSEAVAAAAALH